MRNGAKECVGGQASHKPILDNRITRSIRSVCNKPEWHIVQPPASLYLQSVRRKFIIHWCTWVPNSAVHKHFYWRGDFVPSVGKIFSTGWKYLAARSSLTRLQISFLLSLLPSQQLVQGRGKTDFPEIYECCAFYHVMHRKVSLSLIWMQHSPTPATLLIISTDSDQRWGVKKVWDDQSSRGSM